MARSRLGDQVEDEVQRVLVYGQTIIERMIFPIQRRIEPENATRRFRKTNKSKSVTGAIAG